MKSGMRQMILIKLVGEMITIFFPKYNGWIGKTITDKNKRFNLIGTEIHFAEKDKNHNSWEIYYAG